jgi:hypothetical protein
MGLMMTPSRPRTVVRNMSMKSPVFLDKEHESQRAKHNSTILFAAKRTNISDPQTH